MCVRMLRNLQLHFRIKIIVLFVLIISLIFVSFFRVLAMYSYQFFCHNTSPLRQELSPSVSDSIEKFTQFLVLSSWYK